MTLAIEALNVEKRYGALQALAGVSLAVAEGEFFGLLGPNGAGKTTLISIIAGLARASAGQVRVMGADVVSDYRRARRMLGVVPQELVFDPFFTVRETLRIQSGYFGLRRNDAWIEEILYHLELTAQADANMRTLSGGMKRRVLVAQALVHRPPVIVLDEPTAGVDVGLRQGLWQFIRRLIRDGHTIVLTTHYLEEAEELCERIAMLKAGRIVALDSTRNLLETFSGLVLKIRLDRNALPDGLAADLLSADDGRFTLRLRDYNALEQVLHRVRMFEQVSYAQFLVPGLVMMSVLQNAFANSSSSLIQSKITGNLVFMMLPPISYLEFFGAYVLASMIRGLVVGAGVLAVTVWFVELPVAAPFWVLAFALLGAAILGALGLIAGIWADSFEQIAAFQNFVILPLTFLSGVFYSIRSLPDFWQKASHFNPFFYMIDGFRRGFFGISDVPPLVSLTVVAVSFVLLSAACLLLLRSGYKLRQ